VEGSLAWNVGFGLVHAELDAWSGDLDHSGHGTWDESPSRNAWLRDCFCLRSVAGGAGTGLAAGDGDPIEQACYTVLPATAGPVYLVHCRRRVPHCP
jgi:hypothetical protein